MVRTVEQSAVHAWKTVEFIPEEVRLYRQSMAVLPLLIDDPVALQTAFASYWRGNTLEELTLQGPFREYLEEEKENPKQFYSYQQLFWQAEDISQLIALGSFKVVFQVGTKFLREDSNFPILDFFQDAYDKYLRYSIANYSQKENAPFGGFLTLALENKAIDTNRYIRNRTTSPHETEYDPNGKGRRTKLRIPVLSIEYLQQEADVLHDKQSKTNQSGGLEVIRDEYANGFEYGRSADKPLERFMRIAGLTPDQQIVVEKKLLFDISPEEIAMQLQKPVIEVYKLLRGAKVKIERNVTKDRALAILDGYK